MLLTTTVKCCYYCELEEIVVHSITGGEEYFFAPNLIFLIKQNLGACCVGAEFCRDNES